MTYFILHQTLKNELTVTETHNLWAAGGLQEIYFAVGSSVANSGLVFDLLLTTFWIYSNTPMNHCWMVILTLKTI